jgi:hypothetical protein
VRATALWSAGDNAGFLLGAGAGGILLGLFGADLVLAYASSRRPRRCARPWCSWLG